MVFSYLLPFTDTAPESKAERSASCPHTGKHRGAFVNFSISEATRQWGHLMMQSSVFSGRSEKNVRHDFKTLVTMFYWILGLQFRM